MKTFVYNIGVGSNVIRLKFHAPSRKEADVLAKQHADKKVCAFEARLPKADLAAAC